MWLQGKQPSLSWPGWHRERDELASLRGRLQELAEAIGEAQSIAARYQSEGEQLNEKLHLLQGANPDAKVCPLCLTPLNEDGCQALSDNYQREIQEKRSLYRTNRDHLQLLEKDKKKLEAELPRQERDLAVQTNRSRQELARLEAQLEASSVARDELERATAHLQSLASMAQAGDFAVEPRNRLCQVEMALQDLAYDEEAYRQTYQLVRELEPYIQLKLRLEQARNQLPEDVAALDRGQELVRTKRSELELVKGRIEAAETAVAELPTVSANLERESQTIVELEVGQQSALARRGFLEGQVNRLAALHEELDREGKRLSTLQEEHGIFQELVGAFGRQGIQAMLIETVVPRLEEETNLLLGRMTDNRMHVKLETQRDRRSGGGGPNRDPGGLRQRRTGDTQL